MAAKVVRAAYAVVPLPKGEEAKARQFYGQALGLKEVMKPPALAARGGVWFETPDGFQLRCSTEEELGKRVPGTGSVVAFEIADVEGFRQDVTRRQLMVQDLPPIPGQRRFLALDPFGNRLEFLQRG